jgi:acyl carrier protein
MDHKPAIREFLRELLARKGDKEPFSDQTSLVLSGRLQSIDAVELSMRVRNFSRRVIFFLSANSAWEKLG